MLTEITATAMCVRTQTLALGIAIPFEPSERKAGERVRSWKLLIH